MGTAYVRVAGDFTDLNSKLVGVLSPQKLGKVGKIAGAALAGGVAAAGIGKVLYDIGAQFDKATDTIRTQTGATGKELAKLEGSFKSVISSVPTDFDTAAKAVAGLNQRLDLTGRPLERLSKQLTALSEITGSDIQENVESVTRLFGDWSVRTRDQSRTLDRLFRLTQETGIGFSDLSRLMVQFGSPLRQLGFQFDEAAVMFARFEREGVNMQTLLPGLRYALKNISIPTDDLAKQFKTLGINTKEPHDALLQIFDVLSKDKISEADQTLLASSVFGGRAWTDMKAAVEEGRFEFEDLISTMRGGDETIRGAERSTRDFSEQWQLFRNRVMVWLEPLATKVFGALGTAMQQINRVLSGRGGFAEGVSEASDALRRFWQESKILQDTFEFLRAITKRVWAAIVQIVRGAAQALRGVVKVISGVLTLNFDRAWGGIKDIFRSGANFAIGVLRGMTAPLREIVSRIGRALKEPFRAVWGVVVDIFVGAKDRLREVMGGIGRGITNVLRGIRKAFKGVADVIRAVVKFIVNAVNKAVGALGDLKDKIPDITPDVSIPDVTPWSGLAPWKQGGLAAVVPGTGVGDTHTLAIDGRPVARVESREGIFVGNRSMMQAAAAANAAVPRRATGGIVPVPGFPGERMNSKVLGAWQALAKRFNLFLTDAYGPGHASPEHTKYGTAVDVVPGPGGSWKDVGRAVGFSVKRGYTPVYYDGSRGSVNLPPHGPGHHAHITLLTAAELLSGKSAGGFSGLIPALKVKGKGPLAGVAQGAADKMRALGNRYLRAIQPMEGAESGSILHGSGDVERVFAKVAKRLSQSKLATLALGMAGYAESGMRDLSYGHSSSQGALQLLSSTAAGLGVSPHDEAAIASLFFTRGFYGRGGANALARQGLPAHLIAQGVQGSAFASGSNYLAQKGAAKAWMKRFGLRMGGIVPPFAGSFGGGGVVPGPKGAPRTAVVHGGEEIGPGGHTYLLIEDGAVNGDYIREISKEEYERRSHRDARKMVQRGPVVGMRGGVR